MKLLLIFALVAVVASSEQFDIANSVPKFRDAVFSSPQLNPVVPESFRRVGLATRDACDDAAAALAATWETPECVPLHTVFNNKTSGEQRAALTAACPTDCNENLIRDIDALRAACTSLTAGEKLFVNAVRLVVKVACSEADGEYCLPKFTEYDEAGYTASDPPTTAQLDQLCTPCIDIVVEELAAVAPALARLTGAIGKLACLMDDDKYCLVEFHDVRALPDTTLEEVIAKYERACSTRCYSKFFAVVRSYLTDVPETAPVLGYELVCNRNEDDVLCISEVLRTLNATASNPSENCGAFFFCGAACKASVESFFSETGCCGANFASLHAVTEEAYARRKEWVEDTCDLTIPDMCPGFARYLRRYAFRNLRWAYFVAHRAELELAIRRDVAATYGIRIEYVVIVQVTESSAGTRDIEPFPDVEIEVTDPSGYEPPAEGDYGATFISLSDVPEDAKVNPDAPIVVNADNTVPPGAEEEEEEEESAASACFPAVAALVLAGAGAL